MTQLRPIHFLTLTNGGPAYCRNRRGKYFTIWVKKVTCKRCLTLLQRERSRVILKRAESSV